MNDVLEKNKEPTKISAEERTLTALESLEMFQSELKKLKKKLRKAEDQLNEVRSCHDAIKKEIKKRKKKLKKKALLKK